MLRLLSVIMFFAIFANIECWANNSIITGFIFNKKTGKALPGATIRVLNKNIGTYSSTSGFFRLQVPKDTKDLKVSSIGHKSKIVNLHSGEDTIFVYLKEIAVKNKGVTVTGNIEPMEIIRRAIAKKQENVEKLKTFKGRLYSKIVFELDGTLFANSQGGKNLYVGTKNENSEDPEKYRAFLFETFSDVYIDFIKNVSSTYIIQRRQTANLKPSQNLMAISKFINLYDDEVRFGDVSIQTPLSKDAFSYYKYKIIDKQIYDDKYVYVIDVIPATKLFPAFKGILKIFEDNYAIVEADLQPSNNTVIAFIDSLRIKQKYNKSIENIWYPAFFEITGKARFEVVKGLLDLKADLKGTSIYSDVVLNKPLPDSIYHQEKIKNISVAEDADSTKANFWENNSLREVTRKERDIYHRIDSLVANDSLSKKSNNSNDSALKYTIFPYIDYNRVNACSCGLSTYLSFKNFTIGGLASYSLGLKRVFWEGTLSRKFNMKDNKSINLGISAFSKVARLSLDRSYANILNTFFAGFFHFDYYDYMRQDGLSLSGEYKSSLFNLESGINVSEQTSLRKMTNSSLFSKAVWRENPNITEGKYIVGFLKGQTGDVNLIKTSENFENELEFSTIFGTKTESKKSFYSLVARYKVSIPLIYTGYRPIKLYLSLEGAYSSANIPMQYMPKMQSSMLFITKFGQFLTAPPSKYGGREYYATHAALNLGDLWWRALGLPLYEGRGLNLILSGAYSRFFAKGNSIYCDTGNEHYSEIGFGLSRIPTFISNVFYLSFDVRWGIGPVASGRFGWALSISLPF